MTIEQDRAAVRRQLGKRDAELRPGCDLFTPTVVNGRTVPNECPNQATHTATMPHRPAHNRAAHVLICDACLAIFRGQSFPVECGTPKCTHRYQTITGLIHNIRRL